ncbi:MAG TPA: preprotein translocase subunit SecA [Candidatus Paceibacterota bacterium]|nr:preprotein translocase subunit SecA [Candidatus Paceibacterota bacterium]
MANFLSKVFSQNQSAAFIKSARGVVSGAQALSDELEGKTQEELQARLQAVKERTNGTPTSDADIAEVFALVREAARRTLSERHYDVQLMGGLALAKGKIAEMRTGEGKTLTALLPATLRALAGKGVHLVTVNDYLARRDGSWMGQVYAYLGLTVGVITSTGAYVYDATHVQSEEDAERDEEGSFRVFYDYLRPASKQDAYAADITYATNNELGFDYLRDNTAYDKSQITQRGHHYAIIDEVDSILIDEARTPLIISGPAEDAEQLYARFAGIARQMVEGEDYTVDEKQKAIQLTSAGITKAEQALNIENLYTEGGIKLAHHLETAVRAKALFTKDKEYVVQDGNIVIVDEFTGRMQPGRRWSEGLHQAIEAKEGVTIQRETRTYASVTFQNLFRMYDALAGMTGTGLSSEEEFYTVYGLDVIVIPTHRAIARIDHDDLIFQTSDGKYRALTREIKRLNDKGQPVLIGTVSIEDNEVVSNYLRDAGIPHEVLNAKNHEREGELIAQAGQKGRVTVATNLAGRGVDIKLGGAVTSKEDREEVRSLGGLFVIGTERHEARRIDNQLRGRSGRQGDPGETQFYVSLDDRLMRVFASNMLARVMGTFKIPEDEPIGSPMISRSLETAQKRIEGFNFDSRKQVLAYDDVLNTQRLAIYADRRTALLGSGEEVETRMLELIGDNGEESEAAKAVYDTKKAEYGPEQWTELMRRLILQTTDALWLEHLEYMEYLRRSVSLRSFGQRDPLIEYRRDGLLRFRELEASIAHNIREALPRIIPADDARIRAEEAKVRAHLVAASEGGDGSDAGSAEPIQNGPQIGRNDTVTIRKGEEVQTLKYKKAEALLAEGWTIVS